MPTLFPKFQCIFECVFNPDSMKISSNRQILFFKNDNVLRLEADGNQTIIYFIDGNRQKIDEPIKSIEAQLKDPGFIRIHDRHIVNVNHIARIAAGNDDFVEMSNAEVLPIETGQKQIIVELLANHLNNYQKI